MTDRISPAGPQALLRRILTGSIMGFILLAPVANFNVPRLNTALAQPPSEDFETVSGTLDQVNVGEKKGTLTTDLGKQVAFQIVKPELFMNLSPGQRVTLKLDQQGRAVRVMDNAAPELPPPASGPR